MTHSNRNDDRAIELYNPRHQGSKATTRDVMIIRIGATASKRSSSSGFRYATWITSKRSLGWRGACASPLLLVSLGLPILRIGKRHFVSERQIIEFMENLATLVEPLSSMTMELAATNEAGDNDVVSVFCRANSQRNSAMTRFVLSLALASVSIVAYTASAGAVEVEPDKENVVASRIEGNWQSHKELTKRLTGKVQSPPSELPFKGELSFNSDPSVAEMVPDKYAKFFTEQRMKIQLAGYLTFDGKKLPFVVTQIHGNPHVIFWLEQDGDPFGNGESFNVMLAVAKDRQNDLLFVGGDFNNQPFSAFERVKTEPSK